MNTTNLFVELVVIGIGTLLGLGLLVLSLWGYTWIPWSNSNITSSVILIPFLSITYLLGIVIDRIADDIYKKWDRQIRKKQFPNNEEYHTARTYVYTYATDKIISLFDYGRSRLRISRAWSINCILLGISIPIFIWTRLPKIPFSNRMLNTISCILIFGIGTVATYFTWKKLAINDYKRLAETSALLKTERENSQIKTKQNS